uniref:Rho-GAP domain-containing protein n=1 Tax=Panagrolaimus sp. JU765 TaxID=591449 RepID=A0AC34RAF0_9BILA
MPAANMGALGYLMRHLQEIAEQSNVHHMTIENLATVFAPSIFRSQPSPDSKKKRTDSQENLLTEMKRMNELKVLIVQVMIENAEKIGVAKDIYKASRRPLDMKKKEKGLIASSVQRHAEGRPPIYECANE